MSEQLPRHDIPQNEWTEIVIERETRRGVEHIRLRVPFTSNEVADIVAAREAISKLKDEAARGSGMVREVYVRHGIPWGYSLRDRQEAFADLTTSKAFLDQVVESHGRFIDAVHLAHIHTAQQHVANLLQPPQLRIPAIIFG